MKIQANFPIISGGVMSFPCTVCKKETEDAYVPYIDGKFYGRYPCCKEHSESELLVLINNIIEK